MPPSLAELERELSGDPKSRRFHELAREYQKLGRLDEAMALCEKGLGHHPSQWQARIMLAQLYSAKARLEDARQMVERVLLPLPDNIPANHLAADIYFTLGEKERALKHYQIVDLLDPGRPGVAERLSELSGEAAETSAGRTEPPRAEPPPPPPVQVSEPLAQPEVAASLESLAPILVPDAPIQDADRGDGVDTEEPEVLTSEAPGSALEPWGIAEGDTGATAGADWAIDTASFDQAVLDDEKSRHEQPPEEPMPAAAEAAEWDDVVAEVGSLPADSAAVPAGLNTVTLADLYERQGYPEKAIEIYQRILLQDPENRAVHDKIASLMLRMAGEAPEGPPVHQEDVERALRRKRVTVLQDWLRRVREGSHV